MFGPRMIPVPDSILGVAPKTAGTDVNSPEDSLPLDPDMLRQ